MPAGHCGRSLHLLRHGQGHAQRDQAAGPRDLLAGAPSCLPLCCACCFVDTCCSSGLARTQPRIFNLQGCTVKFILCTACSQVPVGVAVEQPGGEYSYGAPVQGDGLQHPDNLAVTGCVEAYHAMGTAALAHTPTSTLTLVCMNARRRLRATIAPSSGRARRDTTSWLWPAAGIL